MSWDPADYEDEGVAWRVGRKAAGPPYRDTADDAIRMLRDEADLAPREFEGARIEADPEVVGCWLVTLPNARERRFLVYTDEHFDGAGWEEVDA